MIYVKTFKMSTLIFTLIKSVMSIRSVHLGTMSHKKHFLLININNNIYKVNISGNRRGRDRMVVGFITTYAISAYHHWCCEFESRRGRGVQHYVIKFVSDFRQVGGFLRVLRFPPPIKLTVTILLKYCWKWR